MSRIAVEKLITTPENPKYLSDSTYSPDAWNLGCGLVKNLGTSSTTRYIAPYFDVIRPLEESTGFAVAAVFSYRKDSTSDYIWGVENSTGAANTRRVMMWTLNRKTGNRSWNGFITLTLATSTAHTVRDFKVDVKDETSGTVSCSGASVIGSSTLFNTNNVAIGARIGFGSTDPTDISTWYRVTSKISDSSMLVSPNPGTIGSGPYICQEYRPIYVATNATALNGGVHLAKGVSIEDYSVTGTTIALATSADNSKGVYWLKTAATQTNLATAGAVCDFETATPTSLDTYVLDATSAGNYKVFKYNLRATLASVAGGISLNAFSLDTGLQGVTGTISQNYNCSIATAQHGTGSGVKSMYFVTTSRIYRAALSNITSGAVNWSSDVITEVPTGGITTYAATATLTSIEYISDMDAFLVSTTGLYNYLTKYVASGTELDLVWGKSTSSLEQSTKAAGLPYTFNTGGLAFSMNDSSGSNIVYLAKNSTTAGIGVIYALAVGCHWDYSPNAGVLISPEIPTPNVSKYYRAHPLAVNFVGTQPLGKQTEPFELYARTQNIQTDSTSSWTLLDQSYDLSAFSAAPSIQYKVAYKVLGDTCIPTRILGVETTYEDLTTDSHYATSVGKSSLANKIFAFWFKTAFGYTVPNLRISLYNADTAGLLLTDTATAQANGVFQKTTDGTAWSIYDTVDRSNSTTYIRYTPTSLADNVKVAAYLTQA